MKSKITAITTVGAALCLLYVGFKWGEDMLFIAGILLSVNAVWDIIDLARGKNVR